MAGLCAPLSTLRQYPHGYLRMTRGRCGSLFLHRDGLAPSTPCRSPGALRSTPVNRRSQKSAASLKGAMDGLMHAAIGAVAGGRTPEDDEGIEGREAQAAGGASRRATGEETSTGRYGIANIRSKRVSAAELLQPIARSSNSGPSGCRFFPAIGTKVAKEPLRYEHFPTERIAI
jgi:hypothetical protein